MTLLGTLLRNRRAGEAHLAWNRPNLHGGDALTMTSLHFDDGATMPLEHAGTRIGGQDLSPQLTWTAPPPTTAQLVLVIEDIDVPLPRPAVHCLALIDPTRVGTPPHQLPAGALGAQQPGAGVRVLRSTIGRGYRGPEPIKGHGPHRYTIQLFALGAPLNPDPQKRGADRPDPAPFSPRSPHPSSPAADSPESSNADTPRDVAPARPGALQPGPRCTANPSWCANDRLRDVGQSGPRCDLQR